jgi:hypothetical protein
MTRGFGRSFLLTTAVVAALALNGCGRDVSNPAGSEQSTTLGAMSVDTAALGAPLGAQFARARAATARYHDISVALGEGFIQVSPCISSPEGTMGFHYLNPSRLDGAAVVDEPEALLYLEKDGRWQLVGLEYLVPVFQNGEPYSGVEPPAEPGPTPRLFGEPFDGPLAGHAPGEPWHYELHVWLWRHNPAGMFAPFNPSLSCS